MTPNLEAGDTGWCSDLQFTLPSARTHEIGSSSACAPAYAHSATVLAGGAALTDILSSLPNPPKNQGRPPAGADIQPAAHQTVWINWFVVSDQVAAIRVGTTSYLPQPNPDLDTDWHAVVIFTRGPLTTFVPLDRHHRPINQTATQTYAAPIPVTTINPHHPPRATCALGASDLPGVGDQWEVIADHTPQNSNTPSNRI